MARPPSALSPRLTYEISIASQRLIASESAACTRPSLVMVSRMMYRDVAYYPPVHAVHAVDRLSIEKKNHVKAFNVSRAAMRGHARPCAAKDEKH